MSKKGKRTVSEKLIDLAKQATLFTDEGGTPWARTHGRCYPIDQRPFKQWLRRQFYRAHKKAPHAQGMQEAINQLCSIAAFDGDTQPVHVRIAGAGDKIIIDLGNDDGINKITIKPESWTPGAEGIANFWRPDGYLPLPQPAEKGDIDLLKDFLNFENEADFRLMVAWLLAALNPHIACPILVLQGEQGSAKSTTAKMLRGLVDPNGAPICPAPRDEKELYITAVSSHVTVLDNLSGLRKWLSDTLCRVCTGTGFKSRKLYTDDQLKIYKIKKPLILNGIDDIATRGDLLDRSIVINLPAISSENRKDERKFWKAFRKAQPAIMAALYQGVAYGLNQDDPDLNRLPRMADFADATGVFTS